MIRPLLTSTLALLTLLTACGPADADRTPGAPAQQVPENDRYGGTAVVSVSVDA
nr:hypothetical protein [Gemmatimonadaceae bacterium]